MPGCNRAPRLRRAPPPAPLGHVGVAFDGSPSSRDALNAAGALADRAAASLHVICVVEPTRTVPADSPALVPVLPPSTARLVTRARAIIDSAVAERAHARPVIRDVAVGRPSAVLATRASDVDLLVCGSRGYGRAGQVLVGDTSARLAREAQGPLLVVPKRAVVAG